ncbi:MAG: MipA/OmpV family protein [Betaproteobacteria bacterium]|nr:MipA/OmpV family protein [Betaproteobacteria bacterium]
MKVSFPAGLLLLFPALALAQAAAAPPEYENLIGPAVRSRPAYDGSKSQRLDLVPILDYEKNVFFARTVQGVLEAGARASVGGGWKLGGQLAYEEGRKASESSLLRNMNIPDVSVGLSAGLHAEWEGKIGPAPVIFVARWRDQLHSDRGSQTDLRGTVGVYESGPVQAGVYAQATWATQKSMRTYYAAPGFDPGGGLLGVSAGVIGSYDLAKRWQAIVNLEAHRLQGDAARSPLTERRSNYYLIGGVAYRF